MLTVKDVMRKLEDIDENLIVLTPAPSGYTEAKSVGVIKVCFTGYNIGDAGEWTALEEAKNKDEYISVFVIE
ncbi:MAG: hypothetical protein EOM03_12285 [Clostridia bacterium]|nr:hypothetical protein [Clostridia bacterium]